MLLIDNFRVMGIWSIRMHMRKGYLLIIFAAAFVLLWGCCGNAGHRRTAGGAAERSGEKQKASFRAAALEEPRSEYGFNVEKDAVLTYEYDKRGKVTKVYMPESFGSEKILEYPVKKRIYDQNGKLLSLEAEGCLKKWVLYETHVLKAEYDGDSRIVSLTDTRLHADSRAVTEYEICYGKDGGIEVYRFSAGSDKPDGIIGYNADLSRAYFEEYFIKRNGCERRYREYVDGVEAHYWRYCAEGWLKEEITYYENGCAKEYFEYDKRGNVVKHRQYGRNGRAVNRSGRKQHVQALGYCIFFPNVFRKSLFLFKETI